MDNAFQVDPSQVIARTADANLLAGVAVVTGTGDNDCALAGADAASGVLGVNLESVNSGEAASIVMGGIVPMLAGAAIARNSYVTTDSQGRAVAFTPNFAGATPVQCLGYTLDECANANETVSVKLLLCPCQAT